MPLSNLNNIFHFNMSHFDVNIPNRSWTDSTDTDTSAQSSSAQTLSPPSSTEDECSNESKKSMIMENVDDHKVKLDLE